MNSHKTKPIKPEDIPSHPTIPLPARYCSLSSTMESPTRTAKTTRKPRYIHYGRDCRQVKKRLALGDLLKFYYWGVTRIHRPTPEKPAEAETQVVGLRTLAQSTTRDNFPGEVPAKPKAHAGEAKARLKTRRGRARQGLVNGRNQF